MSTYNVLKNLFLSSLLVTALTVSSSADTADDKGQQPTQCEWDCHGWWFPSIDEIFSRSIIVHPEIRYQSSINFKENSKAYTVNVILPDIDKKEISVNVINNVLVIAAQRKSNETTKQLYSSYHQSIVLPQNADIDKIYAKYKKGSIAITIPKTAKRTAKKITIR